MCGQVAVFECLLPVNSSAWISRVGRVDSVAATQLPEVNGSIMAVETAVLRCQRSGVSIEVSPNSPRSAKSTASETPGGGGSAAGGTSSGA